MNFELKRGDTRTLIIPLGTSPAVGDTLIFTVKKSLSDTDTNAVIQKTIGAGLTFTGSNATVILVHDDTKGLESRSYHYDIQAQTVAGAVSTLVQAKIALTGDVTRTLDTAIPIFTTEPTAFQSAAASAASATASALAASGSASTATTQAGEASTSASNASASAASASGSASTATTQAGIATTKAGEASASAAAATAQADSALSSSFAASGFASTATTKAGEAATSASAAAASAASVSGALGGYLTIAGAASTYQPISAMGAYALTSDLSGPSLGSISTQVTGAQVSAFSNLQVGINGTLIYGSANVGVEVTMPTASGTLALTADLAAYVPTTRTVNGQALSSDITIDATPADNSITNAKLATVATSTIKGRSTAGTGNVQDITVGTGVLTALGVNAQFELTRLAGRGIPSLGLVSGWEYTDVVLSSGAISQWNDITGGGNHLTQSNAAKRWTVGNGGAIPSASPIGYMLTAPIAINYQSATIIFAYPSVGSRTNAFATEALLFALGGAGGGGGIVVNYSALSGAGSGFIPSDDSNVVALICGPSGRTTYLNSIERSFTDTALTAGPTTYDRIFSRHSDGLFPTTRSFAAVLIYNRVLTAAEVGSIMSALTMPPLRDQTMIIVGDSISRGFGATTSADSWAYKVPRALGYSTINAGNDGRKAAAAAAGGSAEALRNYTAGRANDVVLMMGTNDLSAATGAGSTLQTNLQSIAGFYRSLGTNKAPVRVFVATVLPRTNFFSGGQNSAGFEADRNAVNTWIRANWPTFADGLIDIGNPSTLIGDVANIGIYMPADGTHPNNAGHSIIATVTQQTIIASAGLTAIPSTYTAYAAGTAHILTSSAALLDFGTTDPTITIATAGTYLIQGRALLRYNAATYAANQSATLNLRRTNNTPADIANTTTTALLRVITATTDTVGVMPLPPVIYTATAGDVISVFGSVSATPSAGSVDCTEASIVAVRIY